MDFIAQNWEVILVAGGAFLAAFAPNLYATVAPYFGVVKKASADGQARVGFALVSSFLADQGKTPEQQAVMTMANVRKMLAEVSQPEYVS